MDLLNPNDEEFKRFTVLQWSGLHETLRPHLKEQNGCLTWFHGIIERAVTKRYLDAGYQRIKYQKKQVAYFIKDRLSTHTLLNLPWLYYELGDWHGLRDYVGDSD